MSEWRYRIKQDGMVVAQVSSFASAAQGMSEIHRYAAIYGQDGPVTVEVYRDGRWKTAPGSAAS